MNDAPEPTPPSPAPAFNLDDLRLLPDWMKADAPAPPGAARREERRFEEPGDRGPGRGDRRDDRRPGGPRPGGFRGGDAPRGPRPGGGGGFRDDRGPRPGGGGPRDRRDDRRGGGPPRRFDERPAPPPPTRPAPVRVEFLPDARPLAGIAKEIRSRHLAYPLFGLARMFLERPESHRIRLSAEAAPAREGEKPAAPAPLFQLGEDGPIALSRATLENLAFDRYRERFYVEEKVQKDPPKGNFTAVARERGSGVLLGPPNHHSYQGNLRALYEGRYARRMDFEEFRRGVEIVNDPALVERWKEEIRTVTTYTVRDTMPAPPPAAAPAGPTDEAAPAPAVDAPPAEPEPTAPEAAVEPAPVEAAAPAPETPASEGDAPTAADAPKPVTFENLTDVRNHFRQHYLDGLLRSGTRLEMPGPAGRQLPEPSLTLSLRLAHEQELRYPAGLVQPLRVGLQNAGLHIFKHRKRVVYVSAIRPTPFRHGGESGGAVSEGISAILETVAAHAMISGKDLAAGVVARRLGPAAPATAAAAPSPGETPAAEPATAPVVDVEIPPTEGDASQTAPAAPTDPRQEASERFKAHLAADLRYLIGAGHVIAFHNSTFDLPLPPRPKEEPKKPAAPVANKGAVTPTPVIAGDTAEDEDDEPAETAADQNPSGEQLAEPSGEADPVAPVAETLVAPPAAIVALPDPAPREEPAV